MGDAGLLEPLPRVGGGRRGLELADVAVIGLPDAGWGEAVTAVIIPAGDPPALEELRGFARARLAGYKVPRRLEVAAAIPRTASGKIIKHQLKAKLA